MPPKSTQLTVKTIDNKVKGATVPHVILTTTLDDGLEDEWEISGGEFAPCEVLTAGWIDHDRLAASIKDISDSGMKVVASLRNVDAALPGWVKVPGTGVCDYSKALGFSDSAEWHFDPGFSDKFEDWSLFTSVQASAPATIRKSQFVIMIGALLMLMGQGLNVHILNKGIFYSDILSLLAGTKKAFSYNTGLAFLGSLMGTNIRKGEYKPEHGPHYAYLLSGMYGLAHIWLENVDAKLYSTLSPLFSVTMQVFKIVTKDGQKLELISRLEAIKTHTGAFSDAERKLISALQRNIGNLIEPPFIAGSNYLKAFEGSGLDPDNFRRKLFFVSGYVTSADRSKMERDRPVETRQLQQVPSIQQLCKQSRKMEVILGKTSGGSSML